MNLQNSIKNKLYALFFYQTSFGEIYGHIYSYINFKKNTFQSSKIELNEKEQLESYLIKQYHIIEKGLSLPNVRLGFGEKKIKDLLFASFAYLNKYGSNRTIFAIGTTLKEYLKFNEENKYEINDALKLEINRFIDVTKGHEAPGGVMHVSKSKLLKERDLSSSSFINTRHSIRVFSGPIEDSGKIERAITLAKKSPSVCNRQGWKVHYYKEPSTINDILALQHGTTGFTEQINDLMIVTSNSKSFTSYEYKQQFIDGGIFSMGLMLSLHSEGVGVCPLNACFPYLVENKIKEIAQIPTNENIVLFLAIGEMEDEFKVAISNRKENDEILRIHQ